MAWFQRHYGNGYTTPAATLPTSTRASTCPNLQPAPVGASGPQSCYYRPASQLSLRQSAPFGDIRSIRPHAPPVYDAGPTHPAGVTPATAGVAHGPVMAPGVSQGPMTDTGTAGAVECGVHAGASDAKGVAWTPATIFTFYVRTAALELGAHGMVTDGF